MEVDPGQVETVCAILGMVRAYWHRTGVFRCQIWRW